MKAAAGRVVELTRVDLLDLVEVGG